MEMIPDEFDGILVNERPSWIVPLLTEDGILGREPEEACIEHHSATASREFGDGFEVEERIFRTVGRHRDIIR